MTVGCWTAYNTVSIQHVAISGGPLKRISLLTMICVYLSSMLLSIVVFIVTIVTDLTAWAGLRFIMIGYLFLFFGLPYVYSLITLYLKLRRRVDERKKQCALRGTSACDGGTRTSQMNNTTRKSSISAFGGNSRASMGRHSGVEADASPGENKTPRSITDAIKRDFECTSPRHPNGTHQQKIAGESIAPSSPNFPDDASSKRSIKSRRKIEYLIVMGGLLILLVSPFSFYYAYNQIRESSKYSTEVESELTTYDASTDFLLWLILMVNLYFGFFAWQNRIKLQRQGATGPEDKKYDGESKNNDIYSKAQVRSVAMRSVHIDTKRHSAV
ncbi:hypothetical protein AAMO2058_001395600 [Amorphochlora amoebiformis]